VLLAAGSTSCSRIYSDCWRVDFDPRGSAAVCEKRAATNRRARAFRPALGSQSWHAASSLALVFYRYILCVTDSSCASISSSAAQSSRSSVRLCLGVHLPDVSRSRIETGRSAFLLADRPRCTLQGMTWSWAIVTVSRECLVPRLRAATGFYALRSSRNMPCVPGLVFFLVPLLRTLRTQLGLLGGKAYLCQVQPHGSAVWFDIMTTQ
jgi:hypothetical protein